MGCHILCSWVSRPRPMSFKTHNLDKQTYSSLVGVLDDQRPYMCMSFLHFSNKPSEAASTPGHALEVGTRCKLTSHVATCSVGLIFIPFVNETLEGFSRDTIDTIYFLGQAICRGMGATNPTKNIFQSLAIWRGNFTMWLHRDQTHISSPGVYTYYLVL